MSTLKIPTAKVFGPLLQPARYKGAHGGRGSGKSHFFGELLVETCQAERGTLAVCIREAQRTLAQSSKRLIESKIASLGLGHGFRLFNDKIETPGDGLIIFRGMQDHTADSIKSLEGFRIAWVDEAQSLSARSLALLRPTIRAKNSELWASWNPRRKSDAIDDFLRARRPPGALVVNASWRDNPWFPAVLEEERQLDLSLYPDRYDHIWEGDYVRAFEGAYFATMLSDAKAQGRIGKVSADPLLPLRAFIDIGGSGATADAFTIWIVQWAGAEILADLHRLTFFDGAPIPDFEQGYWWLAYRGEEPVAFAGVVPSTHARNAGYFCRVGVLDDHCGRGLQLRLTRAVESRARRNGWGFIVSDTTDNITSANNFIRAGYRLHQPQIAWAWPHSLYWKKSIASDR
ncbi:MAG TPA: phage terminase large subunit [Sphingomicrobium sp.]|nr:phage terminase large subunit [Sphingomicrobium sp.]